MVGPLSFCSERKTASQNKKRPKKAIFPPTLQRRRHSNSNAAGVKRSIGTTNPEIDGYISDTSNTDTDISDNAICRPTKQRRLD